MSAIFILKKEPPKKTHFFFLRRRYFVMGGSIDMRVLKDFCGLSKKYSFATFLKIYPELC